MKCSICKKKIEITFLEKIDGTFVLKKPVCKLCQKEFILKEIKEKIHAPVA